MITIRVNYGELGTQEVTGTLIKLDDDFSAMCNYDGVIVLDSDNYAIYICDSLESAKKFVNAL